MNPFRMPAGLMHRRSPISRLSIKIIFILLALTGFVGTHKIQAEEECSASNVLCYECDSRQNPECADPFEFSFAAYLESASRRTIYPKTPPNDEANLLQQHQKGPLKPPAPNERDNETSSILIPTLSRQQTSKQVPTATVCHGCCVKLTSKTSDGSTFVKRTCTTNLQINYFMVGLVCMNESGERGKMCFCETDYCNGMSTNLPSKTLHLTLITAAVSCLTTLGNLKRLLANFDLVIKAH